MILRLVRRAYRLFARPVRMTRQQQVGAWCAAAFGYDHAASLPLRGLRLAEEAIEAAQAAGSDRATLHRLIDHVYDRPAGDMYQELGGVGITLLALGAAAGMSVDAAERDELTRILSKPLDHFRERNDAKERAGFGSPAAQGGGA